MSTLKFIHAADLHIDSPLRGLRRYEGAPVDEMVLATRQAFSNLINICLKQDIAFLVLAGDIFDYDWDDYSTALFVCRQLQRLADAKINVYMIFGNHDAREDMSRNAPWPDNVFIFDHEQPQTYIYSDGAIALHGMSYARRVEDRNLVPMYPEPIPQSVNIGLLHTNAVADASHQPYAPCQVEELTAKGYDYWALGHVHSPKILHRNPWVVYSGNTQGRHIREPGEKGCYLVTVHNGKIAEASFVATDVMRWHLAHIELETNDELEDLEEKVRTQFEQILESNAGRRAAVRLRITGRCQAHHQLQSDHQRAECDAHLRALANASHGKIWLEKISFRTQSVLDIEKLRQGHDLVGDVLRRFSDTITQSLPDQATQNALEKFLAKIKPSLGQDDLDWDDQSTWQNLYTQAERILLDSLDPTH